MIDASLPNFLIVGAAKSGTTSLYNYLNQHGQIFMPEFKEPQFFVANKVSHKVHNSISNENDYFDLFSGAQKYPCRGEASVFYLYYYDEAIKNILHYIGKDTKIIIILRNPSERAFSAYKHVVRGNPRLMMTFEDALKKEEHIVGSTITPMAHYKRMGLYYQMVKAYKESFDNTHVVLYDDLQKEPNEVITNIFNFLELDQQNVDISIRHNSGKDAWRTKWMGSLISQDNAFKAVVTKLPFFLYMRSFMLKLVTKKYKKIPEIAKKDLIEYYRNDIDKLSKLINSDLSDWTRML